MVTGLPSMDSTRDWYRAIIFKRWTRSMSETRSQKRSKCLSTQSGSVNSLGSPAILWEASWLSSK